MPTTSRLLQQLRAVMKTVREGSSDPAHIALLTGADMVANELLLQDASDYYVQYLRDGQALLDEGLALIAQSNMAGVSTTPLRADIDAQQRYEILQAEVRTLRGNLWRIVERLKERCAAQVQAYLARVSTWEAALYMRSATQVPAPAVHNTPLITQEALLAYLTRRFPTWKDLKLTKFSQIHGGFSKTTILFECEDAQNGRQSLVLRAELPMRLINADGSDVTREFPMIHLMHRAGLPVAEPLWLEEDAMHLGHRFLVSRKASGQTIGDTMGARDAMPAAVLESMLETLFALHQLKLDSNDTLARRSHLEEWLPHRTVSDAVRHFATVHLPALIERAGIDPSPAITRALMWLKNNVPACDEPPAILHMDFALNNLLIENNRVSAILDWETSRLGDPADELRWTQLTLNQYITMPELLQRYKQATGRDVSAYRLAYSKVAGCVYATIAGLNAVHCFDTRDDTPMSFAFLGFRYLPMLGFQFDTLIAEAETVKDR
jgi:aminoglycoside phosphotransferase (APT) family kinase protein